MSENALIGPPLLRDLKLFWFSTIYNIFGFPPSRVPPRVCVPNSLSIQEEEWRQSPQSSPQHRVVIPKGFRSALDGGSSSGAASSLSLSLPSLAQAAAGKGVEIDALCRVERQGKGRGKGKGSPPLPGIISDALPDDDASGGSMKRILPEPLLKRQRQGKLPVWPPRGGIKGVKGFPLVELPDVSVWS